MFAYPRETISGSGRVWKLLLQALCRAKDRVAVAKERMVPSVAISGIPQDTPNNDAGMKMAP